VAIAYGLSWWKIWKEKPSAKGWGIAAGLITSLLPLWSIVRFSHSLLSLQGLLMALGVLGLVVFLRQYEKQAIPDRREIEDSGQDSAETDDTAVGEDHF